MVKRIKWVDRKFQFTMPVGVYPCILERLRGTPVRMESFVAAMPPERLTVQINEAWSIQEHIGHSRTDRMAACFLVSLEKRADYSTGSRRY